MDEDMKQIRFTIPGQPFGKQRPKFSRAGAYVKTYTPKETTSYENLVKLFYNEAAKGKMFPEGGNAGCKDNCILRNSEVHQQEEAQGNVGTQDQTNQEAGLG